MYRSKYIHLTRKYTLLQVYASSFSQAGGTHQLWVSPAVRGENHTPITGCIFSHLTTSFSHGSTTFGDAHHGFKGKFCMRRAHMLSVSLTEQAPHL